MVLGEACGEFEGFGSNVREFDGLFLGVDVVG
jgi:hypothetical protein